MALSSTDVHELVDIELARVVNETVRSRIRALRITSYAVEREWYYGTPGQRYTCWAVLEDPELNAGIAYGEEGFGPRAPWGLVTLSGPRMGIGPDFEWFSSPEAALKESPLWGESALST